MRKYINIIGVGNRMSGTAKNSGKPYDFTPVSFTYEDGFITGVKCAHVNIAQNCMPSDYKPAVGDTVEAFVREDFKTGRVYVDGIL